MARQKLKSYPGDEEQSIPTLHEKKDLEGLINSQIDSDLSCDDDSRKKQYDSMNLFYPVALSIFQLDLFSLPSFPTFMTLFILNGLHRSPVVKF